MKTRYFTAGSVLILMALLGCAKNEPLPVAGFAYAGSNGFKVPCTIHFTNQSQQAYSYNWWFGADSSVTTVNVPGSVLKDPSYTYTKPGTFTVTLRAYTESRKEWATRIQTITIADTVK